MSTITDSVNAFTCDLYRQLAKESQGNFIVSPYSISAVFAMVQMGAREKTAEELNRVFHFPPNLIQEFQHLRETLPYDPSTLNLANAMFYPQESPLREEYLATLQSSFQATPYPMGENLTKMLEEINAWVAAQTGGQITEILRELSSTTALVLANAIAFKGAWEIPFDASKTREAPFTTLKGETKMVQMMTHTDAYGYAFGDTWQAVNLRYGGDKLAMTALLPANDRFEAVQSKFTFEVLTDFNKGLRRPKIILNIPRWETESAVNLIPSLQTMGIQTLFDAEQANLSGASTVDLGNG